MAKKRPRKSLKEVMIVFTLPVVVSLICGPTCANTTEDILHPRYYTSFLEETPGGEIIPIETTDIHATVGTKSIIRILFNRERLFQALRTLAKQGERVSIRIEAYVKPEKAEEYPVTVERYSTVIRKTETAREESLPEFKQTDLMEQTKLTRLNRIEYEIYYYEKTCELVDAETGQIAGSLVDTYMDLASLRLVEGDRLHLNVSDVENHQHLSKILEVKKFGLQVYFTTPITLTYRLSESEKTFFPPSPGTTVVFKMVGRRRTLFEDWLHPGINIAFLDFDEQQSIEIGLGLAFTIYKDFFEIGYGYNLSVKEDRRYWYIGLNIVRIPGKGA